MRTANGGRATANHSGARSSDQLSSPARQGSLKPVKRRQPAITGSRKTLEDWPLSIPNKTGQPTPKIDAKLMRYQQLQFFHRIGVIRVQLQRFFVVLDRQRLLAIEHEGFAQAVINVR